MKISFLTSHYRARRARRPPPVPVRLDGQPFGSIVEATSGPMSDQRPTGLGWPSRLNRMAIRATAMQRRHGQPGPATEAVPETPTGLHLVWSALVLLMVLVAVPTESAKAQEGSMLEQCRALSIDVNDINNCMDNFLDLLDQSLADIEQFVVTELDATDTVSVQAAAAFERAQAAFRDYRRENCLWYLEFSVPRQDADQIAKDCLATMSQTRLNELQRLVSTTPAENVLVGYYVYGAERNTLQLCGDTRRYWVEGDAGAVGGLQQDYLTRALTDLAVLYIEVTGAVDTEAGDPYPDHDGVFRLERVKSLRPPADGDCQLATAAPTASIEPVIATLEPEAPIVTEPPAPADVPATEQLQPEQLLQAYFGAWEAECEQLGDSYGCRLSVALEGEALEGDDQPILRLTRRSRKRTIVDLEFPGQEIDLTDRILWRIDQFDVGPLASSRMRVDSNLARQEVRDRPYIQDQLLPLLTAGESLFITVREEDGSESSYTGTLLGLTRAINFSDDFTLSDGRL